MEQSTVAVCYYRKLVKSLYHCLKRVGNGLSRSAKVIPLKNEHKGLIYCILAWSSRGFKWAKHLSVLKWYTDFLNTRRCCSTSSPRPSLSWRLMEQSSCMLLQENREVAVPLFGREMVMCSAKTVQTLKKCLKSSFGITDNSFNKPRARYIQAQWVIIFEPIWDQY